MTRSTQLSRSTSEVSIEGRLTLDGSGSSNIDTGLGFLDHMLGTLSKHSGFDLDLAAKGDTDIDDHHTVEDVAIVIGRGLSDALEDRTGITRFGSAYVPLDESLARAVVDLSGRPWSEISLGLQRDKVGDVSAENLTHFFRSLASEARMALHVDVLRGDNDHHKAESSFKATAVALRSAVTIASAAIPSTKGTLT